MLNSLGRGVTAGLLSGLLAGVFALVVGEPSIDAAIALEEAAAEAPADAPATHSHATHPHTETHATPVAAGTHGAGGHVHGGEDGISRSTQKLGLLAGMLLYGAALGLLFGAAYAWSQGRLQGDAWTRATKLGAAAIFCLVLLPSLKFPPNPPAVGDPDTVGARTQLLLFLWVAGAGIAAAAWWAVGWCRRHGWSRPLSQSSVGLAGALLVGALLYALPRGAGAEGFPADLLWSFRVSAIATQVLLFTGMAALYGLLAAHEDGQVFRRVPGSSA